MFQYCPSCASKNIRLTGIKFNCPDCDFTYFHNTAAASGCVIETDGKVMLLVRGNSPAKGKLDLPGGFVDPGEGILEGLMRELKEEIGWAPPIPPGALPADYFKLFASFPNTYPYKNIVYNTCDMFFTISVPSLKISDLKMEAGEIAGIKFLLPGEIEAEDLAFDSTRRAMEAYKVFKK